MCACGSCYGSCFRRWGLPIHLLDALFHASSSSTTAFENRGLAADVLEQLRRVIDEGYRCRALQRLPHVTQLNPAYYHSQIKPLMAKWAFLWLQERHMHAYTHARMHACSHVHMQKQHLHGIDYDEAVRYMLHGAAARSEAVKKLQKIDLEITRLRVQLGHESQAPELPTRADMMERTSTADDELPPRVASARTSEASWLISNEPAEVVEVRLAKLVEARAIADEQRVLMNSIYAAEEQLEEHTRRAQGRLVAQEQEIAARRADVDALENPRDASLDNKLVVWASVAFGNRNTEADGDQPQVTSQVGGLTVPQDPTDGDRTTLAAGDGSMPLAGNKAGGGRPRRQTCSVENTCDGVGARASADRATAVHCVWWWRAA